MDKIELGEIRDKIVHWSGCELDRKKSKWIGPLYLFFAFSLAGTSVVSARFVSGALGTVTIASASLFFALLFLLPLSLSSLKDTLCDLSIRDLILLALQAIFGIFLFRMFLLHGLLQTSSMEAGILTGATPAITAVLAMVFLREPFHTKKLAGILCTVGGILFIQGIGKGGALFSSSHLPGNLLVLCAAASESLFNMISRIFAIKSKAAQRREIPLLVQTTIVSFIAFVLCLIPSLWASPMQRLIQISSTQWFALVWYGLFVTALAFICWYGGIQRCGAVTAAAFSGMMPFSAMVLSILLLGEQAGCQQWTGAALVILGMIFIGTGDRT